MALTQAMLKAMGIEDEKRDQIMEAHQGVLESLKADRDGLKETVAKLQAEADKVPDLQRQLKEAEKPVQDEYKPKFEELQKEFEDFKTKVEGEKAAEEKKNLYSALLRDAGIDEKRVQAILKVTDLGAFSVENGAIVDEDKVKESLAEEWSAFIPQEITTGAEVPTPPAENATITGADPETVQRLAERHERLYGKVDKE